MMSLRKLARPSLLQKCCRAASSNSTTNEGSTVSMTDADPVGRPRIPHRHSYTIEDITSRRQWVEEFASTSLDGLAGFGEGGYEDTSILKGNIEMPIGLVKIPVAVAGPILFNGNQAQGFHLLPLATTEGALVASVNRGATLLTESGGVETFAGQQQMTRGPMFQCKSAAQAYELGQWAQANRRRIQEEVVQKHSRVAFLKSILPIYDQETVHTLFLYETGDASGQNATTICTWKAINWIMDTIKTEQPHVQVKNHWIDGNLSGDKKPCAFNGVIGRGVSVSARCEIPEKTLNSVMNITSDLFYEWYKWQNRMVSRVGAPSNLNITNVLAASFAATGQDIACVGESAGGMFTLERGNDGLIASMHIPSLIVGTVGGGTKLPTQEQCLSIMGCVGAGKVRKFAEIVAAYCLSLDLSTGSAAACGEFADSHDRLGRNRPA